MKNFYYIIFLIVLLNVSCKHNNRQVQIHKFLHNNTKVLIDDNCNINVHFANNQHDINFNTATITTDDDENIFKFKFKQATTTTKKDSIGDFWQITIVGDNDKLEKTIQLKLYKDFQNMLVLDQQIKNISKDTITIDRWESIKTEISPTKDSLFWSFNGSSSEERADWILPVKKGFFKQNFLGMNDSDYGGGIPVSALWRPDYGIAVGHTSLTPELVSIPISFKKSKKNAEIELEKELIQPKELKPNEQMALLENFIQIFNGDCFKPLRTFSKYMQKKGIKFAPSEPSAYEPIWCAWGYERKFTIDEILQTLPKVKELGYKWVVIDDGYQIDEGDWNVNPTTFPNGDKQMIGLVNKIHHYGLKAKIWWTPLAIGMFSDKLKKHPEVLLRNENESPEYITWWDAFYMSPNHPQTIKETKETIDLFLKKWNFDGFKMDGQHLNSIPPDYNPQLSISPEQTVRELPKYFKSIYKQVRKIKPHAVIENCPCGTCMSFYNMTSINQAVSSDPESSWQIRSKGKVYKALIPQIAYYGDHVELSDNGSDFASSFGIGAVLGSKFTWPKDNPFVKESFLLTPEKEKIMKKWLKLYNQKQLSKGKYLGELYDIGFDKPETHVIKKDDTLYYAFYANHWDGKIKLRGLTKHRYKVYDYYNDKFLGTVELNKPDISVSFKKFLLIELIPK